MSTFFFGCFYWGTALDIKRVGGNCCRAEEELASKVGHFGESSALESLATSMLKEPDSISGSDMEINGVRTDLETVWGRSITFPFPNTAVCVS